MNSINLNLTDDQVNLLLESIELLKSKLVKERNQVRTPSEIDANYLTALTLKIHSAQNIRKQITN